ncbi:MAG: pilus assembly protein [Saccharospirillum sp.]
MKSITRSSLASWIVGTLALSATIGHAQDVSQTPLFVTNAVAPQVMISMSNDHQLFFEAYPEYVDLDGDGESDQTYKHSIDYYGYFDSNKCYDYDTGLGRFVPVGVTSDKYCDSVAGADWSGNFLNWVAMSRMDVVRKILYGGFRSTDTSSLTVLERSYLPMDAHAWARHYDGTDIARLTPFAHQGPAVTVSSTSRTVGTGTLRFVTIGDSRFDSSGQLQNGDQIEIRTPNNSNVAMRGYVDHDVNALGTGEIRVRVSFAQGSGTYANWEITNLSRSGVSFCNVTYASSGNSQNITAPPLIRVAQGDYGLWTANERMQCHWSNEENSNGRINFNDAGVTAVNANRRNPNRSQVGLGAVDYVARVEVCATGLIGDEDCKQYEDGNYKPIGLLQTYGDEEVIDFGLMSGSNVRNKSGGVLRKNIGVFSDEVNVDTDGTFVSPPASVGSIINSLNTQRVYGYRHNDGIYNNADNCVWGLSSFNDGQCTGWGNPQSEIFLETVRYFANDGSLSPTNDFTFSGDDRLSGMGTVAWEPPLNDSNYCAPLSIINFNSSVASYDNDSFSSASDLPDLTGVGSVRDWTNKIGEGEGIHGQSYFVGSNGTDDDGLCTSKTVGTLADAVGLCPEAPRLQGSYLAAGLANYAYTTDLRPDLPSNTEQDKRVKTYAVALAPAVPEINIPLPGQSDTAVRLLPACYNTNTNGACAIVDFSVIGQDVDAGTGSYLVNWEDSEQGGDYDMDMIGILSYKITDSAITVTTRTTADTSSQPMGFGYIISGTQGDGFHVTSGINGFTYSPPGGGNGCNNCNLLATPVSHTYALAGGIANLLQPPMFYAAKWGGFDRTMDFPSEQASWDADADGTPDNYYFATSPRQLADDLDDVFRNIQDGAASAAAVVANSSRLGTDTAVFQATFNTERWSGDIRAFSVDEDGVVEDTPSWAANDEVAQQNFGLRRIYTSEPVGSTGAVDGELLSQVAHPFQWSELTTDQQQALRRNDPTDITSVGDVSYGQNRLDYLRGDKSNERIADGNAAEQTRLFRQRNGVIGTIVNSDPQFYFQQDYGYSRLPHSSFGATQSYADYRASSAYRDETSRPPLLLVGSNNGMLHAINANLDGTGAGQELFAYVPSSIIDNLYEYTLPDFQHRFYVDGTPRVADAIVDGAWTTVAVGTTGAGGNSVFALDISNPTVFNENDFLWEFTHPDLGYTMGQPSLVALPNNTFGVIVTSGYRDDGTSSGKVWVLDVDTGRPMVTLQLSGAGELGAPLVVDLDGDRIADRLYVGDTEGQLWRVDFDGSNVADWEIPSALSGGPLFQTPGNQPITASLASAFNENREHMVFFGTGSYYREGDNLISGTPDLQAFYGIIDREATAPGGIVFIDGTDDLLEQTITQEVVASDRRYRIVSENEMNSSYRGWYLDLVVEGQSEQGERVISRALVRGDRVIFPTLIPDPQMCAFGGDSWLMEVDLYSGGRLNYPVFDVNNDGEFDDSDAVQITDGDDTITIYPSGLGSEVGIITTPAVIEGVGDGNDELKVVSGSTGQIDTIAEAGSVARGRLNWEQLR